MQHRKLYALLSAALFLIVANHVWGDTIRCGNSLVEVGDSMVTVRALCGAPTMVQHGVKVKATTVGGDQGSQSHTVAAEVPVDTWTYNRGPNKFLVNIRFVDGQVVAITTLDQYGN
jgi:hypothetical protein